MPDMEAKIVRGHLQNVSIGYTDAELLNTQIFPILDMPSSRAKITRFNRGDQYRDEAQVRARGTAAAIMDFKTDEVNADTRQYALASQVTDEDLRDEDLEAGMSPPMNLAQEAVERTARKIDLGREIRVANTIFAGTWGDGVSGGKDVNALWAPTDSTNTFLTEIATAKKAFVNKGVGTSRLRLVLDYATMEALKRVAAITDQLKYTSSQSLSEDTLAAMLGIEKVLVAQAIKSTAKENKAGTDFTGAQIWEKNAGKGSAFLYHYPVVPGRKTLAAGYQPRQKCSNGEFRLTKTWREEKLGSWMYETQEESGITVVAADAGYLWVDTLVT